MISARTKASLQAAKAHSAALGTPNPELIARHAEEGAQASATARSAAAGDWAAGILTVIRSVEADCVTTLAGRNAFGFDPYSV